VQKLPRISAQFLRTLVVWLGTPWLFLKIHVYGPYANLTGPGTGILAWIGLGLMILGSLGGFRSGVLILQFAEPTGTFRLNPQRLVHYGYYARNRHPGWWSFQVCLLGALLFLKLPWPAALSYSLLALSVGSLYLLLVEEPVLLSRFGAAYLAYKKAVPFWGITFSQPDRLEPTWTYQIVWLTGHIFFRWRYGIIAEGLEHIPRSAPFLIVAPHTCYLDPFLFGIFVPFPVHFITTADAYNNRVKEYFMHRLYTFPLRRHIQDLRALRKFIQLSADGKVVGMFPEGERSMDGRPGEIVPETIKLLQRCRVPLLPVEIRGAFEIWPRWTNVLRQGKIHIRFKPVISVANQWDAQKLVQRIRATIFPPQVSYQSVRSNQMTKGIEKVLWGCVICGTFDRIVVTGPRTVKCEACGSAWLLDSDYHLHSPEGERIPLYQWLDRLAERIQPWLKPLEPPLNAGETLYLRSKLVHYIGPEIPEPIYQNYELLLTDQAFVLREGTHEEKRWPFSQVTVLTVDTINEFSLGISGKRYRFRLPAPEHPLKWHVFFKYLTKH